MIKVLINTLLTLLLVVTAIWFVGSQPLFISPEAVASPEGG